MKLTTKAEAAANHRVIQVVVLLYSFLFFGVIAYGYFYLFVKSSIAVAYVVAALASTLAWFLAKFIGSNEGGIRAHVPMFVLLLTISAAGVYNSAMLNWEGGRILSDVTVDSQGRYTKLQAAAEQALVDSGVQKHLDDVDTIKSNLFEEMRHKARCGQGEKAVELITQLRKELPKFETLTGATCDHIEDTIAAYSDQIEQLKAKAPWNDTGLKAIVGQAEAARAELGALNSQITTQYSPGALKDILAQLEKLDETYRSLHYQLGRRVSIDKLPPSLDLSQAKNLGDATKLPALIIERLDTVSTYVYLILAGGFDWLMVYLFIQARRNRFNGSRPAPIGSALHD